MAFQRVAHIDDIPDGTGHCVRVGDLRVGLFRVDGAIFAMENHCPHQNYPLHKGVLTGSIIVCEAHGWEFDVRTGFNPVDDDGWPIPCFAVRVDDGEIHIDVDHAVNIPQRRHRPRPDES